MDSNLITPQTVAALGLVLVVLLLLSWRLRLNQEKAVAWASVRMTTQLVLLGAVLHWVFAGPSLWVFLWVGVATVAAAQAASSRIQKPYPRMKVDLLASLIAGAWGVVVYGLVLVVGPQPWHTPQFLVPLLGMVLGNMLNGLSLGLDHFLNTCRSHRTEMETALALGATRWEAASPFVRASLRTAMVPILNAMTVAGLVSLPGMMTGQILAGAPVAQAVAFQIVILLLVLMATFLGSAVALGLAFRRLFHPQLRLTLGD